MTTVAFIGLGNMGAPMSLHLIRAGHDVVAYDIQPAAMQAIVSQGARGAASAAAAVSTAEVVISMLPASAHVEDVYLGSGAVLDHAQSEALLVDCSTIAPETSRKVAAAAAQRGFEMLDAPVSGGVGGAVAGTLTFIVGGPATALERGQPLLALMGKHIFHAGASGAGQVAKICNNLALGIAMIGTCEALQLGVANHLDPKVLSAIMQQSSGGNWVLNVYNPYPGVMENVPAARGYEGGFVVDLMVKDLGLALETAQQTGVTTPLGGIARSLYALHSAHGAGRLDFSSILQFLQRQQ